MSRNHNKGKQVKKQRHIKGLLLLCLFLLIVSSSILFGLNKTRKDLISECENDLLWEVQLTAREVSEDIGNKLVALETIQEMITHSYEVGPDALEGLRTSKGRYNMSYLGLIDKNYVYYDSDGDVVPNKRSEYAEAAMSGKNVIFRAVDEVSGDGVVVGLVDSFSSLPSFPLQETSERQSNNARVIFNSFIFIFLRSFRLYVGPR